MAANGVSPCAGGKILGRGDIKGDLATLIPQAGGRVAQPSLTRNADDGLDEGCPVGLGQVLADGKDLDGAVLLSGSGFGPGRRRIGKGVAGNDGVDDAGQQRLVAFKLDRHVVPRGQDGGKRFFGCAWQPA